MWSNIVFYFAIVFSILFAGFDSLFHFHSISDDDLKEKVIAVLEKANYRKGDNNIDAAVAERRVTLSGLIRSDKEIPHVLKIVGDVEGVKSVASALNGLILNTEAFRRLELLLKQEPMVYSFAYMISPKRVVTLTGNVETQALKDEIGGLSSAIIGVKKVENNIIVGKPLARQIEEEVINILRLQNIYFDFNKSSIRPESMSSIKKIASVLRKHGAATVSIEGHTDNVGSKSYNMNLSSARASSVKNALIQEGVNNSAISSKGYGETRPLASNNSPENRAENRRIEFKVTINK